MHLSLVLLVCNKEVLLRTLHISPKGVQTPGIEPGFTRPQRVVLTVIRCLHRRGVLEDSYHNVPHPNLFFFRICLLHRLGHTHHAGTLQFMGNANCCSACPISSAG